MKIESIEILSLRIDRIDSKVLLDKVDDFVNSKFPHTICFLNPHIILLSLNNRNLKDYINNADIVVADGAGILIASKILGKSLPERVTGTDFMFSISDKSSEKGYKIYLLGAEQDIAIKAEANMKKKYPKLNIVGIHSGYFNDKEENNILADIKQKAPDILIVCMGVPKQELWIKQHKDELGVPVIFGNGAALDFVAERFKRAPIWMQKCGLEWVFRLIQEPKRLWKRYIVGNILFFFLVLKQKLGLLK